MLLKILQVDEVFCCSDWGRIFPVLDGGAAEIAWTFKY